MTLLWDGRLTLDAIWAVVGFAPPMGYLLHAVHFLLPDDTYLQRLPATRRRAKPALPTAYTLPHLHAHAHAPLAL